MEPCFFSLLKVAQSDAAGDAALYRAGRTAIWRWAAKNDLPETMPYQKETFIFRTFPNTMFKFYIAF